jgi:hypothetical protein
MDASGTEKSGASAITSNVLDTLSFAILNGLPVDGVLHVIRAMIKNSLRLQL